MVKVLWRETRNRHRFCKNVTEQLVDETRSVLRSSSLSLMLYVLDQGRELFESFPFVWESFSHVPFFTLSRLYDLVPTLISRFEESRSIDFVSVGAGLFSTTPGPSGSRPARHRRRLLWILGSTSFDERDDDHGLETSTSRYYYSWSVHSSEQKGPRRFKCTVYRERRV